MSFKEEKKNSPISLLSSWISAEVTKPEGLGVQPHSPSAHLFTPPERQGASRTCLNSFCAGQLSWG